MYILETALSACLNPILSQEKNALNHFLIFKGYVTYILLQNVCIPVPKCKHSVIECQHSVTECQHSVTSVTECQHSVTEYK